MFGSVGATESTWLVPVDIYTNHNHHISYCLQKAWWKLLIFLLYLGERLMAWCDGRNGKGKQNNLFTWVQRKQRVHCQGQLLTTDTITAVWGSNFEDTFDTRWSKFCINTRATCKFAAFWDVRVKTATCMLFQCMCSPQTHWKIQGFELCFVSTKKTLRVLWCNAQSLFWHRITWTGTPPPNPTPPQKKLIKNKNGSITNRAESQIEVDAAGIVADGAGRVVRLGVRVAAAPRPDVLLGMGAADVAVLRHS